MESFGVYLDLQEDTLNDYTVSVSEIEQSKQVPKNREKNPWPFQTKKFPNSYCNKYIKIVVYDIRNHMTNRMLLHFHLIQEQNKIDLLLAYK